MFRRRIYLVFKIHEQFAIETIYNKKINTCSSRHTGLGFADFAGQTWLAGFWSPTCGLAAQFTGNMLVSFRFSYNFHWFSMECLDLRHAETKQRCVADTIQTGDETTIASQHRYSCSVNVLPIVEWHRIFPTCKQRSNPYVCPTVIWRPPKYFTKVCVPCRLRTAFLYLQTPRFFVLSDVLVHFSILIVSQPRNPVGH